MAAAMTRFLDWADEPDEPTTLKLSVTREYRVASSDGDGAGATVRATLTDQYGSPVARQADRVHLQRRSRRAQRGAPQH